MLDGSGTDPLSLLILLFILLLGSLSSKIAYIAEGSVLSNRLGVKFGRIVL